MEALKVHIFEKAGLGKAPFRLVGVESRRGPLNLGNGVMVGAPGQPMGTCNFCGQGIADCFLIRSSDGKFFEVGCDCVAKTGDAGLKKATDKLKREARNAAMDARIEMARARMIDLREVLQGMDNPTGRRGSALEWAEWMMRNAGRSGCTKVARFVEKLTKV